MRVNGVIVDDVDNGVNAVGGVNVDNVYDGMVRLTILPYTRPHHLIEARYKPHTTQPPIPSTNHQQTNET